MGRVGRPALKIGVAGNIRFQAAGPNRVRARCRYRDYDGVVRDIERTGRSKDAARSSLNQALAERSRISTAGEITADTMVADLCEVWFKELGDRDLSPNTVQQYRDRLDSQIVPKMQGLRIREAATVSRCDRLIKETKEEHGAAVAKMTKTVLSGVLGLAARHDAIEANPVRDTAPVSAKAKKRARSLSLDEALELRDKISANLKAIRWDLPDFTDIMLATGLRIGEAAAIVWGALDLDNPDGATVEVRGTVIRIKGEGLIIKPEPKSDDGWRKLELPGWAVAMLRRRKPANAKPNDVVFQAPSGGGRLRDPSNTNADLRVVFSDAGFPWVTSHVYRKTVATLMDTAGLSARSAADQLGHSRVSMTQDVYFGRRVAKTGAAGVLDVISPKVSLVKEALIYGG